MSDGRNLIADARAALGAIPLPEPGESLDLAVLYAATAAKFIAQAEAEIAALRVGLDARNEALARLAKSAGAGHVA